jgi:hypothetical protein
MSRRNGGGGFVPPPPFHFAMSLLARTKSPIESLGQFSVGNLSDFG